MSARRGALDRIQWCSDWGIEGCTLWSWPVGGGGEKKDQSSSEVVKYVSAHRSLG